MPASAAADAARPLDAPARTVSHVSVLDLVIALLVIVAVIGGYRLGFVTRVFSWVGLALGIVLGIRFALPWALGKLPPGSTSTALLVALLVVVIAGMLGQALGFVIGNQLRPPAVDGRRNRFDGVLGGVAGFVGASLAVWLLLPVVASTPGWVSSVTSRSWLAQQLDARFPPPPDTAAVLRSLVGDQFPNVFDVLQPTPDLGPPPESTGIPRATADAVARSVVKVQGPACDHVQDGTGWVAADGVVVTNAHVVAGEAKTQVQRDDGRFLDATVDVFDPARDLAVLRVPKLDRPALAMAPGARAGETGGVFGHPGGEKLRIAPFQVARQITAVGRDIYSSTRTERQVLELSSSLRPGDSGSALVDRGGAVVGVAFAIAPDQPAVAYALAMSEVRAVLDQADGAAVSTGRCV
jgi:S1-C subfamily serine protease